MAQGRQMGRPRLILQVSGSIPHLDNKQEHPSTECGEHQSGGIWRPSKMYYPSSRIISFMALTVSSLALPEPEAGLGLAEVPRFKRMAQGGKCSSSSECVAPNVCSKWGWCQWTTIYGEDGPSQGQEAPGGGRSGQCVTSADCASRVPYCSQLGFCHGGRLPFDEEQLEIEDQVFQTGSETQPQGYINNNPRKNSPIFQNNGQQGEPRRPESPTNNRRNQGQNQRNQSPQQSNGNINGQKQVPQPSGASNQSRRRANGQGQPQSSATNGRKGQCPGEDRNRCLEVACQPLEEQSPKVFQACQRECNERC